VYIGAASYVFVKWVEEPTPRLASSRVRVAMLPALLLLLPFVSGCDDAGGKAVAASVGNSRRGTKLIGYYGCGGCHTIPGITGASGLVGPPLTQIGQRIYIAGMLRNTPDNMTKWLRNPQAVVPGNAMPDMGISASDAKDIAAYLYTLR
jgi:cytochrome c2